MERSLKLIHVLPEEIAALRFRLHNVYGSKGSGGGAAGGSGGANNGGRFTPSPHSVTSGSSSPSSFCQPAAVAGNASTNANGQHVVNYHVHQGEVISLQLGDGKVQVIPGKTETKQLVMKSVARGNEL